MKADGDLFKLAARKAVVVGILEQVLADPSHAATYFKNWPSSVQDISPELSCAWGALEHFCNDADLRKKDSDYEQLMLRQLSEILADLKKPSATI